LERLPVPSNETIRAALLLLLLRAGNYAEASGEFTLFVGSLRENTVWWIRTLAD
jgi:hypothetical protein